MTERVTDSQMAEELPFNEQPSANQPASQQENLRGKKGIFQRGLSGERKSLSLIH